MTVHPITLKGRCAVDDVCVAAVIVTYNPEPSTLEAMLTALQCQVHRIVIVDNGSQPHLVEKIKAIAQQFECTIETLGQNEGIAAAQNRGIALARLFFEHVARDCQYVLLLDHDSIPASDMVSRLLISDRQLRASGERVGAVGAVSIDRRTGTHARFIVAGRPWLRRMPLTNRDEAMRVVFLIASGTLLRADVLDAVGGMNQRFFIDHVDTEWCLRATQQGYALFAVGNAFLEHSLGDEVIPVWICRRREVFVHSPLRDYYMCRNTVLMLRTNPMPSAWRAFLFVRMIGSIVFFGVGVAPRRVRLLRMWQGVRDGLAGRGGARTF
ncbi:glycosyltransferase family 2 protein [Burkholderia dolosa]|uniref:glycosyltransferase family 2 protein n=1 Tax=Burkholderia dolosa TaxID=152500 RepID=UPI001B962A79|nr:glycosyltransferase family 2 protein [Burkholderia dolosa]MBR8299990.1 glycosyltransferase family 2 protein [Burkholderia dolosa]MDN7447180.1 glycosyltransferase family 2 protein [Burkholderia multivorans]